MRASIAAGICLATIACHRGPDILNHDPASPEIAGLQRLGDGGYQPGTTERFRAIYSVSEPAQLHWATSAGQLVQTGDEVAWTLPDASEAALTVSLETKTRVATSTFRFRLAASGGLAMGALPSGTIDGSGASTGNVCDLVFDGSGNPAVIYRNDTHPAIWLAKWSGSAWQTELVDGMGYETGGAVDFPMSLALAADGTPHIAYAYEDGSLHYATKSGGIWTRERADTGIARANDRYGFIAIALDPSRSGRPTIAYRSPASSGYPLVTVATRSGTWTDTVLQAQSNATYGAYFYGGLAIDTNGVSFFSYWDANAGGPRVGAWAGDTATTTVSSALATASNLSLAAGYQEPIPLALDGNGKPLLMFATAVTHVKPGDATVTFSPYEESAVWLEDLAFAHGKPGLAVSNLGNLELITTDAGGFWTYASAGSVDQVSGGRIGAAIDSGGTVHACFRRNSVITYQ